MRWRTLGSVSATDDAKGGSNDTSEVSIYVNYFKKHFVSMYVEMSFDIRVQLQASVVAGLRCCLDARDQELRGRARQIFTHAILHTLAYEHDDDDDNAIDEPR